MFQGLNSVSTPKLPDKAKASIRGSSPPGAVQFVADKVLFLGQVSIFIVKPLRTILQSVAQGALPLDPAIGVIDGPPTMQCAIAILLFTPASIGIVNSPGVLRHRDFLRLTLKLCDPARKGVRSATCLKSI
jgi:hypothetical protein